MGRGHLFTLNVPPVRWICRAEGPCFQMNPFTSRLLRLGRSSVLWGSWLVAFLLHPSPCRELHLRPWNHLWDFCLPGERPLFLSSCFPNGSQAIDSRGCAYTPPLLLGFSMQSQSSQMSPYQYFLLVSPSVVTFLFKINTNTANSYSLWQLAAHTLGCFHLRRADHSGRLLKVVVT